MAQLNAKTPNESVTQPAAVPPARTGLLPVLGVVAGLAIAAGAYFYYQGEHEDVTAGAPQTTASDKTSAPAGTMPLSTEGTSSSAQSASAKAGADSASAAPSAHAIAKPHRVAKASKPASALGPRDRQVFLATRPQPTYPIQALRAGEEGTVTVLAQVNGDGQVTDARVIRPSGSRILDQAAPNEVRHWKFEPALHDGRPVVASIEVPVNYRLNQ